MIILRLESSAQVGHELGALTAERTLASLYVDPLVKIIDGQNPGNEFTINQTSVK